MIINEAKRIKAKKNAIYKEIISLKTRNEDIKAKNRLNLIKS